MTTNVKYHTAAVLQSLIKIKKAAQKSIVDARQRQEQAARIDMILEDFDAGFTLENAYQLTKEQFAGNYGLLKPYSKLEVALKRHYELIQELKAAIKEQMISTYLLRSTFQSNPLVYFEERHGGPLWFDLALFTLQFKADFTINIMMDYSLSKRMAPRDEELIVTKAKWTTKIIQPQYISGRIQLEDDRSFAFETIFGKMKYLYLENPQIWKESFVVKSNQPD